MRHCGRTTRMMEHAIALAKAGRAVYVIVGTDQRARDLQSQLEGLQPGSYGIKVEFPAPSNFDWVTLSLRGAWPNCICLVDHYAIECRYGKLLEMLHAYDPKTEEPQNEQ